MEFGGVDEFAGGVELFAGMLQGAVTILLAERELGLGGGALLGDALEEVVARGELGLLRDDGVLADEAEDGVFGHLLVVEEDLVVGLVFVEDELERGLGVLKEAVLVEAVLVAQEEEAVLGGAVGTSDQALLVLQLEEPQHREGSVVHVLERHVRRKLRLAVLRLVELQVVYHDLQDAPVLPQKLRLPQNLNSATYLLIRQFLRQPDDVHKVRLQYPQVLRLLYVQRAFPRTLPSSHSFPAASAFLHLPNYT